MVMVKRSKLRKSRPLQRKRRHLRVRKKIWGTAERPRLVVFRSRRHLEGQLVDDDSGATIAGLSTRAPTVEAGELEDGERRKVEEARAAGKLLAERAREEGVEQVVFDRGGYRYHGRVRGFAEGAREGGLEF